MNAQPLISTLIGAFVVAFIFGMIAHRLRISPIVGFLFAGIVIGPFTPGFVGDVTLAPELAEIGVVLLMFGIGLHFSIRDLLSVRRIAIPGAIVQIVIAIGLGSWLAYALGWPLSTGMVFGLALSTASTVVLFRELEDRRVIDTQEGRIAVGWLIVQDIAMVVALVVVPTLSSGLNGSVEGSNPALKTLLAVVITIGKVAVFIALMLVVGRRLIPWALDRVSKTGSRELFTLAVLVIALGVAYGLAALFDVSFALGAFFAGLVLHESEFSQKAATDTLPLRDAFAVLFFVAVGMLFNPSILIRQPWAVVATLLIIIVGKSFAAWLIVLAFGYTRRTALTISVSLAQIGEFSFMLAELGVTLGLLSFEGRDLILAGAILSLLINPFLFVALDWLEPRTDQGERLVQPPLLAKDHIILVGYGRVGAIVGSALRDVNQALVVIEDNADVVVRLRAEGMTTIFGNAEATGVLEAAGVSDARLLITTIPNVFEASRIIERARSVNSSIEIVARAHSDGEVEYLKRHGTDVVIVGERELARRMIEHAIERT